MLRRGAGVDRICPAILGAKSRVTAPADPTSVDAARDGCATPRREHDVSTAIPSQATTTEAPPAARTANLTKVYGEGDTRVTGPRRGQRRHPAGPLHRHHGSRRAPASRRSCTAWPASTGSPRARSCIGDIGPVGAQGQARSRSCAATASASSSRRSTSCPTLTALENITLPLRLAGRKPDQEWLDQVVDTVGLADRLEHRPSELSGGQQQRVAVGPGARQPAEDHLRRRADRQPRQPGRRRDPRLPAARASTSSVRPSSWSPTTRRRPRTPTASSSSPTAGSSTRSTTRRPSGCSSGWPASTPSAAGADRRAQDQHPLPARPQDAHGDVGVRRRARHGLHQRCPRLRRLADQDPRRGLHRQRRRPGGQSEARRRRRLRPAGERAPEGRHRSPPCAPCPASPMRRGRSNSSASTCSTPRTRWPEAPTPGRAKGLRGSESAALQPSAPARRRPGPARWSSTNAPRRRRASGSATRPPSFSRTAPAGSSPSRACSSRPVPTSVSRPRSRSARRPLSSSCSSPAPGRRPRSPCNRARPRTPSRRPPSRHSARVSR